MTIAHLFGHACYLDRKPPRRNTSPHVCRPWRLSLSCKGEAIAYFILNRAGQAPGKML